MSKGLQDIKNFAMSHGMGAHAGERVLVECFSNVVECAVEPDIADLENNGEDARIVENRLIDANRHAEDVHNWGLKGEAAGVQKSGSAANMQVAHNAALDKSEQDKKNAMEMAVLLSMLDDINKQISGHNEAIKQLGEEIKELQELKEAIADPDFNPQDSKNKVLMDKYGITQDDVDAGRADAKIDGAIGVRHDKIKIHKTKIAGLEDKAKVIKSDLNAASQLEDKAERNEAYAKSLEGKSLDEINAAVSDIESNETKAEIDAVKGYKIDDIVEFGQLDEQKIDDVSKAIGNEYDIGGDGLFDDLDSPASTISAANEINPIENGISIRASYNEASLISSPNPMAQPQMSQDIGSSFEPNEMIQKI